MNLKRKLVMVIVLPFLLFGAVFFGTAGTLHFWEAWAFIAVWFIPGIIFCLYFYWHDPELLRRRFQSKEKVKEQRSIMRAVYAVVYLAFLIPGLDHRLGWTNARFGAVPLWLKVFSLGMALAGYLLTIWVMNVNRFASRTIQVEANQPVISTGPYHWVRHPMYAASILMFLFTPLALGSYVALPFFFLIIPVFVLRLLNEEKVLRDQLTGYSEYCQGTRYRLVPYMW